MEQIGMREKVLRALIEGKFIKRTLKKIRLTLDRNIGIISRKIFFSQIPIESKKIFFMTFQGDYTCNPKYITEELIRQHVNCEIVWGVRKAQLRNPQNVPETVRMVDRYTYDYYRELASSKIWIINSVELFKHPFPKKKAQVLFETWHGSLGIKRFDKNVNAGIAWVHAAEICGKYADYCVSNSDFENDVYRGTFWEKTNILKYGHPRNDILFLNSQALNSEREKITKKLDLDPSKKYVLYAPTFRDAHNFDCYDIDYERLVGTLKEKFGGEWNVLVRFHPSVRKYSAKKLKATDYIIDVTSYPDIQEIMLISDIAITDYSSWIYDFVLTRRPGFIFATDIELYNSERGFYYTLESTPFPIATNNDELMANIAAFDNKSYISKVQSFLDDKGCIEDGQASQRVVEKIKEILSSEETKV